MKKKMILGLAVAALTFASCSKDEVTNVNRNNPNSINFEVSTGKTRANIVDLAGLQAEGFGVFATNTSAASMFINNEGYKFVAGAWQWDMPTPIMWPSNENEFPVNFYAYYPKANTTLSTNLLADYTIAGTPETQIDLLAANYTDVVIRPSSGNVSLAFKHILSKIDFKVVTGANVTVEVQSIAIRKVGNARTYNYADLSWTSAPATGNASYKYMSAPVSDPANVFVGQTTAASVTGSSGSLMLMPQNLSGRAWDKTLAGLAADQSYIEVVYRIYETSTGDDVVGFSDATDHPMYIALNSDATGPLFVKVGYALPTNWEMSKAYTYTLYLGTPDSSGGNLIDENFVDEEGDDSGLPVVDPSTGEEIEIPEVVFPNKPIGFVVSVEDWGAAIDNPLQ